MEIATPSADGSFPTANELTLSKVNETLKDVESLRSTNKELLTVSNVYTDATDMLLPAPSAIYLGAKLILLSNKCDFNIQLRPGCPLPYPSFRSSLIHVVHQLQRSFLMADDSMSTIQLRTNEMPRQFSDLMKWISSEASIEEKQVGIEMQLRKLKSSASVCEKVANDVVGQFDKVSQLTEELIEATVNKQNLTEVEMKTLAATKKAKEAADAQAKIRQAENERQLKQLQADVLSAKEMFKSSIAEGDKLVHSAIVASCASEVISSVVGSVGPAIINKIPIGKISKKFVGSQHNTAINTGATEFAEEAFEVISEKEVAHAERKADGITALSKAPFMADMAFGLMAYITDEETICDAALNDSSDSGFLESFKEIKRQMGQLRSGSKKVQSATDVAAKGFNLCTLLSKHRSAPDKVDVPDILAQIRKLYKEAQKFNDLAIKRGITKNHIAADSLSCMKKTGKSRPNASTVQAMVEYSHNRTNSRLNYLQLQLSQLEKCSAQRDALAQEFLDRTLALQQIDIANVDYKTIRQCLSEGLKVLAELRDQWLQLVSFAHLMSEMITQSVNVNITSIDLNTSKLVDLSLRTKMTDIGRNLMVDTIEAETRAAMQMSLITKHLAGGYVAISKEFLMPPMRQLDSLLTADDPVLADVMFVSQVAEANKGIRLEMAKCKERCAAELVQRINELTEARGKLPLSIELNRLSIASGIEVKPDEPGSEYSC